MIKKIVLTITIAILFISLQNANALNLSLRSIDTEFSEAILLDRDTGGHVDGNGR